MTIRAILVFFVVGVPMGGAGDAEIDDPKWGRIVTPKDPNLFHRRELRVEARPGHGALVLPTPFPNIVRAWVAEEGGKSPRFVRWMFNKDATDIRVILPDPGTKTIHLMLAESSARNLDGTVVFSALDARVVGEKAALETHRGNHRIGFWINGADYVIWERDTGAEPGKYDVELVYSRAGKAGAEVSVRVGEAVLPVTLGTTGSWYVYQVQPAGEVEWGGKGKLRIEVKSTKQIGAVMNLKAVLLHPKG